MAIDKLPLELIFAIMRAIDNVYDLLNCKAVCPDNDLVSLSSGRASLNAIGPHY
jgi:hypothetical protein